MTGRDLDGRRAQATGELSLDVRGDRFVVGRHQVPLLWDDRFILHVLRRLAPVTVTIESGGFSIDIDLSRE